MDILENCFNLLSILSLNETTLFLNFKNLLNCTCSSHFSFLFVTFYLIVLY